MLVRVSGRVEQLQTNKLNATPAQKLSTHKLLHAKIKRERRGSGLDKKLLGRDGLQQRKFHHELIGLTKEEAL